MNKLLVVGNGFDLAHGLHTSYENFKEFLSTKYHIKPSHANPLHDVVFGDDNTIAYFLLDMFNHAYMGGLWKDVEDKLGKIDLSIERYFDVDEINRCFDVDEKDILVQWRLKKWTGAFLANCLLRVPDFIEKWITTIQLKTVIPKDSVRSIINLPSIGILTFNYTEVFEEVYGFTNVCHIHGKINDHIVFGHGSELSGAIEFNLHEELECGLVETYLDLQKNTQKQIEKNLAFFDGIDTLSEIYTYGFSFSNPDLPYITEICKRSNESTVWHLSAYDDAATREQYVRLIYECGFSGIIGETFGL